MNMSVFPIFWLVIIVLSILSKSKTAGGKKSSGSSGTGSAASRTTRATQTQGPELPLRGRKAKDDDCDYGDANHKYSHDSAERIKQLDSYLKAGLIDKKEYAQMLERYKRAERDFENY